MRLITSSLVVILFLSTAIATPMVEPDKEDLVPAICETGAWEANAVVIHSSVVWKKDFMDTSLGYQIRDKAAVCFRTMTEEQASESALKAMHDRDDGVKKGGLKKACAFLDKVFGKQN